MDETARLHDARLDRRALLWALVLGAAARGICAWVGVGFHSRDDYFHVLQPALLWLEHPTFDWQHSGLPGAGYRSHLLPRLCWLGLRGMRALGITEPVAQLRGLYLAAGLYSLSLIPAMSLVGRRLISRRTGRIAALIGALYAPLPYAGSRLLIEALAMPPLMWGIGLSLSSRRRELLTAGGLLGMACWWRPQVVVAVVGLGIGLWLEAGRRPQAPGDPEPIPAPPSRLARLSLLGLGFALVLGLQAAWDGLTTGTFLGPLRQNLAINLQPDAGLSRSAPWGYLGLLLLLSLPPASFWLWPAAWATARHRARPLAWSLGVFLLIHSLIPHKEDRFILPAIPLLALLFAGAPEVWQGRPSWRGGRWLTLGLGAAALIFCITSQSQQNLRDTMLALRHDDQARGCISMGPELQTFFLQRPDMATRQRNRFVGSAADEAWLLRSLAELEAEGATPNRFVAYAADRQPTELFLRLVGLRCSAPQQIEGWWFDRLLARLNPRRNRRRSPVWIYRCDMPPAEVASGSFRSRLNARGGAPA